MSDHLVIRTAEGKTVTDADALRGLVAGAGLKLAHAKVDNRPVVRSSVTFGYEDLTNPGLAELRERYRLRKVVAGGKTQFRQMLLLRNWVHRAIPRGTPEHFNLDALAILGSAAKGGTFYCTHYGIVTMQCCLALGWQARKLGIDRDHTKAQSSTHHGVTEVWSDEFDKWVVFDAMFDVHFERDGVPLNALELADEWTRNRSADVVIRKGPGRRRTPDDERIEAFSRPACYYWFYVHTRVDYFATPERQGAYRYLFYEDARRRRKTWYQGSPKGSGTHKHGGYRGRFLHTDRMEDVYWSVNRAEIALAPGHRPGSLAVDVDTFTPNIRGLYVSVDGKGWRKRSEKFLWKLHPGKNSVAVRAANVLGVQGPVSSVELNCRALRS